MIGIDRLALNQATTDRWSVAEAVDGCQRAGIGAIGLWRRQVGEAGLRESVAAVRRAGLHVSSLCRGGFFTAVDPDARAAAMADNRLAIDEAAALEADVLVLVSGGLPGGSKDLPTARSLVADALDELAPYAQESGVRLGIEPLHPMFCADRCVVSTLGQALDLALPYPSETVGVVVDTYHVWWDPDLDAQLARAGGRIASFQVCDWIIPLPEDMLLGRGHVGDGHIDFRRIAAPVAAAGYTGWVEVEIFNEKIWATPGDETLRIMKESFARELG
ncbi:sugar phosphate isomerase/epimerase [Rugosimonospora acidiphila]|uniref:Sugar phosphate isomerase/epimerase n=1 Tax=Rugosimonospora acidiphila TaxID=556531 RepID=A0ABP9SN07_9ACTN